MRLFARVFACAALIAFPCAVKAASVPTALYDKAISVSFSVSSNAVCDNGRAGVPRHVQRTIYISSKGRIFSETQSRNRLIGVSTHFVSGANQLVVPFDPAFQTCTATMQFGHESGKDFKFRGVGGEMCTVTGAPTASTPSCSIRAGNPFAL
jgi:hypothetical protein